MSYKVSEVEQRHYAEREVARRRKKAQEETNAAKLATIKAGLKETVAVEDDDILEDLLALGFTSETVGVLPIVPLIAVAWADGEVSAKEAKRILELSEQRGVKKDSEAYVLLDGLVQKQPSKEFVYSCIFVLKEIYNTLSPEETSRAKRNLLGFTHVVAKASGGVLGLFGNKVSGEEKDLIEEIAEWLGVKDSSSSESVHNMMTVDNTDDEDDLEKSEGDEGEVSGEATEDVEATEAVAEEDEDEGEGEK
ncbi:MAG: hypothetical protein CO108_11965 [Deltaproteobacteria bacterium CG_4_9_14_3_um_filter_63_12]|nr:MAG: hypothetical protein CO108_11965 [Deltaproteobacteria bacterium CG_4_9_14_3_um_filter_63_12]